MALIAVTGLLGLALAPAPAQAAAGELDQTFGTAGTVTTDVAGNFDTAFGMAILPDGKIISAGRAGDDFALARYNSDGTLDPSFGAGGLVITDFDGGRDRVHGVMIQPGGKIVVVGSADLSGDWDFAMARYDGTTETTPPRVVRH